MIRILQSDDVSELLVRRTQRLEEAEHAVRPIIDDVERHGDRALRQYARRFDGYEGDHFCATEFELAEAERALEPEIVSAIDVASRNIRAFAEAQLPREWIRQIAAGVEAGQIVRPLDAVAAYIPAGRHPLPSTVMMTVIPAKVAGVRQIHVTSPRANRVIDGVAHRADANRVFRLGGAHAIAAFAFGTATVPQVDRIVGPGNVYVTAAKKLLAGRVAIDFIAGPSEIFIVAADGNPGWIAADMLAQAEHDPDAAAVLLTPSRALAGAVGSEIERQLETLPTRDVAAQSLARNSVIALLSSLEECMELANAAAPEHLSIYDESLLGCVRNAGSVFLGPCSPEAAGDYASGPNHVLPTGGYARTRGGLSSADFVKVISVQRLTPAGLSALAPAVTTLARAEGLEGHARSVEVRRP